MTDPPLNVVMPMLTFVPGAMGGSEIFARALLTALRHRHDVALTALLSASAAGAFPGVDEVVVPRVRGGASTGQRLRTLAQAMVPSRDARAIFQRADVVHYPFTVSVPPPGRRPWVQTLLDVQHLDLPDMFGRAERAYRGLAYNVAARRADRIITISEFSKSRIVERLGVDPDKVDVAYLGVDADAFRPHDGPREQFVLYPAAAWPHKNHARLIEAMTLVRHKHPDMRLVLTGGRRAALGSLPHWVQHLGHVSDQELRHLYRVASCLAFPSLYEGFGLPPVEAMASGCPVAASDAGSLPEICGDAAVRFDPENVSDMAFAIEGAIASGDVQRDRAVERARRFTWAACAAAHLESYATVRRSGTRSRT